MPKRSREPSLEEEGKEIKVVKLDRPQDEPTISDSVGGVEIVSARSPTRPSPKSDVRNGKKQRIEPEALRSPSPPPRSPPRERKRPGATSRFTQNNAASRRPRSPRADTRPRSPSPPPRSPPRERKRPGAFSRLQSSHYEARVSSSTRARENRQRTPSPPPRSPPRERKRPGAGARVPRTEVEAIQRADPRLPHHEPARRVGVQDYVTQHYNSVEQRGREWRQTASKIKGLRSFNNWIKSCIIQKFATDTDRHPVKVLDIGCGKGGDLQKWRSAGIALYVGIDPAEVSIRQASERYKEMRRGNRRGPPLFDSRFYVQDCFGLSVGGIPIVQEVGFDPRNRTGPGGGGGFEMVTMMFCMHYAFESEVKARTMLNNVAGSLKKGGKFIGVIPNSDVLSDEVVKQPQWGNDIYQVKFPGAVPADGIFRPPFGWKYFYNLEEAVEEVPEYVVPWEAFRALAEDFNLELEYRKTFKEIWEEEKDDRTLGPLSERMRVRDARTGELLVTAQEMDAANFYHAFCFYKV
ncbi:hypothetical protein P152DRAFT_461125 [Eremomyces bilateralis CBS 781.70]|uniref:mRNA cap guanine-N(7) methyltransferase n=1 Tax=Eremomyces bilateralis CBS 781.70 TaxID=1392243 RepID=A0A6G1FV93_9PEZI|nr:uncharacterized protein P152DRAFT_461125 [Eremomyces bilateralis CBS 781.70]KAF1809737.1 hypothetical protein P152DRAFT_461125 [Eremomyces bilateralis CBS 781.70]